MMDQKLLAMLVLKSYMQRDEKHPNALPKLEQYVHYLHG